MGGGVVLAHLMISYLIHTKARRKFSAGAHGRARKGGGIRRSVMAAIKSMAGSRNPGGDDFRERKKKRKRKNRACFCLFFFRHAILPA